MTVAWHELADLGFSVFPLRAKSKVAALEWERFQREKPNASELNSWSTHHAYNAGIATGAVSGVFVLDLDSAEAIAEAERRGLPDTLAVDTANGRHVYFRHPGTPIGNRAKFLPGMDIRGDGGYVAAPGSVHPDGPVYSWRNPPGLFELADAPQWLFDALAKPEKVATPKPAISKANGSASAYSEAALDGILSDLRRAPEGERNEALNKAAFRCGQIDAASGINAEQAHRLLRATALAIGLDESEIEPTIESGWTDGRANPRGASDAVQPSRSAPDKPTTPKNALPLEWCEDIGPLLVGLWLIKQFLPAEGLALIYGHSGSGKTFLALDIAMHIALGWEWCGRKVKQGAVVYVGAEGQTGLRNRIAAFKQHHGIEEAPIALIPCPIDLQAPDADTGRLIDAIETVQHRYGRAALIVVDTISKTFGSGKENTDDMATYVANLQRVQSEFRTCVLAVHHRPLASDSTEPRGHGSLKAGVDSVVLVEAGVTKKASLTKQKDGETGQPVLFNIRPITLGEDEDGEPVTSCVVEPTNVDMNRSADPKLKALAKLNDRQRIVLERIRDALEHDGVLPTQASIPDDEINLVRTPRVVKLGQVSDRCIAALSIAGEQNSDTPRRNFDRAKVRLQALGLIKIWGEWLWLL